MGVVRLNIQTVMMMTFSFQYVSTSLCTTVPSDSYDSCNRFTMKVE